MLRKALLACAAFTLMVQSGHAGTRLSALDAPVAPLGGPLNPFYGTINPFYGKISPFWGDNTQFWGKITPFWGTIDPFYGHINPFWGKISPFDGATGAFWGTIDPYWQDAGPKWGKLNSDWSTLQASNATDYTALQTKLKKFIGDAKAFWGPAVLSSTGSNFKDGFSTALLAKYGIDPDDPNSLRNVSAETRFAFFLAWYDGLMSFSGADHADWWMGAVHWTPQLTQIENAGSRSIVGILDSAFVFDPAKVDVDQIHVSGGYSYVNDHGAAVASIIGASHDGKSVMGIAPNSAIRLYNPFDASGTASWKSVTSGIDKLYADSAFVINASLGVPGWVLSKEWADILTSPSLTSKKHSLVLVKAAGNDGVAQPKDVSWGTFQAPGNLILVGSVGPDGQISSFSNTPGEACIRVNGACNETDKLKYRFVVAPGENILVSDDKGGVTRVSGTSFAAPMVTGAVALLQDRWPWLQQFADEAAQIIFQSATDLGAPGVDPVYGWGELNIEASQSPLNFNNLVVYQPMSGKAPQPPNGTPSGTMPSLSAQTWTTAQLRTSVLTPGQLGIWQAQSAYIVAFEAVGNTYRDFTIPLSSLLIGQNIKSNNATNPFQTYLYQRLIDWANAPQVSFASQSAQLGTDGWRMSLSMESLPVNQQRQNQAPFTSTVSLHNADAGIDLHVGMGNGASVLNGGGDFHLPSDFDPATGGVNPVLGFASGGSFASAGYHVMPGVRLTAAVTQKSDNHRTLDPVVGLQQMLPLASSKAAAFNYGVETEALPGVKLSMSGIL